jgi:P2 family phage contractile tail tube protein
MLFFHEATNLFVGDNGPNNSKHLSLESVKLPTLEEITADHHAGGAIGAVKIGGLGLNALEVSFKIKGYDPQIMSQFGLGNRGRLPFTIYGAVRDKKAGRLVELKAVLEGRLTPRR